MQVLYYAFVMCYSIISTHFLLVCCVRLGGCTGIKSICCSPPAMPILQPAHLFLHLCLPLCLPYLGPLASLDAFCCSNCVCIICNIFSCASTCNFKQSDHWPSRSILQGYLRCEFTWAIDTLSFLLLQGKVIHQDQGMKPMGHETGEKNLHL